MKRTPFIAVLCLAACSLAPGYQRPELPALEHYKEAGEWSSAQPEAAVAPRGSWWEAFNDPTLNMLEEKAGVGNQNIRILLARYAEAHAAAAAARAALFPTITGMAGALRQHTSENIAESEPVPLYNNFSFGADVSYELDVWGRIRNAVAAAADEAEATKADAAAAELSVRAELAIDYFTLRGDDTAQAILDQAVTAYEKAYALTQARHNGGAAAAADVDQAQAQLENARTQAADMQLKRAQLEHAIAVLTGVPPAEFSLVAAPLDTLPIAVPPGLPSTLLERRPDIAAAELRVQEANASIGVARAAYFPDFTLEADAGYASAAASSLLRAPSLFWSVGPSMAVTLFDGGRISALTDQARAAYDETAASYRQTALSAYQEVEDNLAAIHQLTAENESQALASAAADLALAQSEYRYAAGVNTYLDVVVLENLALQARLSAADIRTRQLSATVRLIKALGGGWQAAPPS